MHTVLPKDQWPTWEEDVEKGRYLEPYLKEVVDEKAEQEAWNKQWFYIKYYKVENKYQFVHRTDI